MIRRPIQNIEVPSRPGALNREDVASAGRRIVHAAVICDFLEENWHSMDLVGDMLCHYLTHAGAAPVQIRPTFRRRITRTPAVQPSKADRLINRFVDYPLHLRNRCTGFDVFHLVDHSYSQLVHFLPPDQTVVTCHDLDTFRCLIEPERDRRPLWFRMMTWRILRGFQKAAHVIAVSGATRDELLRHSLIPAEKISVIPNGVHPSCSPLPDPEADAHVAGLLGTGSPQPIWLLHVGSTVPRKRIEVLLRVFAAIRKRIPQARMIRIGGPFTSSQEKLVMELKLEDVILVLPFLDRSLLAAVYRSAALLLQTSDSEGFGLPLIEALACGCYVVASDIPVLREVGGNAVTFCPVANEVAWSNAVVSLIQERQEKPEYWNVRQQQALKHAAGFSWSEAATQTARLYHRLLRF